MTAADRAWKRLNARGDARIYQGNGGRPVVLWWPRGQTGNPFCQRNFPGATLEEALVLAESATRPPELSVDEMAMRRGIERRMDNRRLAEVAPDGEFSP